MNKQTIDFEAAGRAAGERFRNLWPCSHVSTIALEFAWHDLCDRTPVSVSMTGEHQRVFFSALLAAAGEPRVPQSFVATRCPRCGGTMRDMRHTAFNPDALGRDGECYLWTDRDYTCCAGARPAAENNT